MARILVSLTLFAVALALILMFTDIPKRQASFAAESESLAQNYPEALIFMQMAARGGLDYFILNQSHANSLDTLVTTGHTPYLFPSDTQIEFVSNDVAIECGYSSPVYYRGNPSSNFSRIRRGIPDLVPQSSSVTIPANDEFAEFSLPRSAFFAAQFLDENYTAEELDSVQRRLRIVDHLTAATMEFIAKHEQVPANLDALEAFIGVERNPIAWNSIATVNSIGHVDASPGNLFVGMVDRFTFQVAMNVGGSVYFNEWRDDTNHGWLLQSTFMY